MKAMNVIIKILAALATVAGVVYIVATYGEQIVAWCKKTLASCKCRCGEEECCCGGKVGLTALLGIFCIAAALNGHLWKKIPALLRLALVVGGVCMMVPGLATDLIGVAVMGAVLAAQYLGHKKTMQAA